MFFTQPTTLLFLTLLTTSSFALAHTQSCNSSISSISNRASSSSTFPSCTHTTTFTEDSCCPDIPAQTKYTLSDCKGCALTTETIPLNCFAPCTASPTVDPTLTTTITECDAVITLDTNLVGKDQKNR